MKHVCETSRYLVIATQDNRMVFVDESSMEVTKVIKIEEQISSLDALESARHLIIGTE